MSSLVYSTGFMDYKDLFKDIEAYETIIIERHTRPDLDALGSQIGLSLILKNKYPNKNIYIVGDMTKKYSFIGKMDEIEDEKFNGALVIIVDVAVSYLVSDKRYTNASKVWVIDHHKNDCDITDYKLVDTTRSAAAEYIAYLVMKEGIDIPSSAATALYGGIITDSGRFMYGANLSETLRVSASLMDFGADAKYIYDNIYIETLQEREMKNYFQERIKFKDGVAWLENEKEVFDKFKCEFNDISRGMLSLMAGIEEIKIWCNFTYDMESNTVKCEFRSRGVEIVDSAKSFGGGGHAYACGCTIPSFQNVEEVIQKFIQLLK